MIFDYSKLFAGISVPCIIILPNVPEFRIIDVNEAYLELTGKTHYELIEKNFFEVFPNSEFLEETDWLQTFDDVLKKKALDSQGIKTWIDPQKDRVSHETIRYLEIANFPVLDERGNIVVIVRSLVDVTSNVVERYLLDEAQTVAKFGNWWIDIESAAVRWSCGLKGLLEVNADFDPNFENVKKFYRNLEDEDSFLQAVNHSINENQILKTQLDVITENGTIKRLKIIGKPDHDGRSCSGIHGIAIDITKEYGDAQKMQEIYFRHNHDFRAPLARILGIAEFMKSNCTLDERAGSLLDAILCSAIEMDIVIKDIVNIYHKTE